MKYRDIWKKILKPEEKVIKEFTLARKYIIFIQIIIGLFGMIYLIIFWPLAIIIFFFALIMGRYLRKANAYCFSGKRVLIHRGWPSTHLISVNYNKITDVTVKEPILEKLLFGSGHLLINTAGTNAQEVVLKHVEKPYKLKKKLDTIRG